MSENHIPKEPFKVKGSLDYEITIDFDADPPKFNINTLTGISIEDNPEAYLYIFGLVSSEVIIDLLQAEKPVIELSENKSQIDYKHKLEASAEILQGYVSQIFGLVQKKYKSKVNGKD